jgi:hypothetical protein
MSDDPLATYLHDHLAGAMHAIELVEAMRDEYAGKPLGQFAAMILAEIESDRAVLKKLADRVGVGSSSLKEMTAWFGEKLSRLKLRRGGEYGLGLLESLEFLALGIRGKLALWDALAVIADGDARLQGTDFQHLAARAESQFAKVEELRLETARTALASRRSASST